MSSVPFTDAELIVIGEMADTIFFGEFGGVLNLSNLNGEYLVGCLQELFEGGWLGDESNKAFINSIKEKLKPLSHNEALFLLEYTKGEGRMKWT